MLNVVRRYLKKNNSSYLKTPLLLCIKGFTLSYIRCRVKSKFICKYLFKIFAVNLKGFRCYVQNVFGVE